MLERFFYHNKNEISKAMDSPGIGIRGIKRIKKKKSQFFKKKKKKQKYSP